MLYRVKVRKPLVVSGETNVDIDAIWQSMISTPKIKEIDTKSKTATDAEVSSAVPEKVDGTSVQNGTQTDPAPAPTTDAPPAEGMTPIKRTYAFAGETVTEEKLVPTSSAEARLYLQSQQEQNGSSAPATKPPLRRPLKRKGLFDPNPNGIIKGLPPSAAKSKTKLNTVEKSKLDWAGFVDKEGIAEELDSASKAKEGYLDRMDFLSRVDAKRKEDMKSAGKK